MAVQSLSNAQIIQFIDKIHIIAQQVVSRMRPHVMMKQIMAEKFAYDGLGILQAREVQGRVQPIVFSDIEHKRRKLSRRRFEITLPLDELDAMSVLQDLEGNYSQAMVAAMEREIDRVIVERMFSDVYTGKEFDTVLTFAQDGGQTVNAQAGLTYEKLLEIKENFYSREVCLTEQEDIVLGISAEEHTQLLQEIELTSGDFVRDYSVEGGRIVRVLGMKVIVFGNNVDNPILPVNAGVRDCFAVSSKGMCLGVQKEMSITYKDRPDYTDTKQLQITQVFDAVRTEGSRVQKVQTTVG